jgi:hypothetical protein
MRPVGPEPGNIPRVFIAARAFQRLRMYIDLCPLEVGGLGAVTTLGADLLVTDIFLLRQRARFGYRARPPGAGRPLARDHQ